jgi:hypothetical protein
MFVIFISVGVLGAMWYGKFFHCFPSCGIGWIAIKDHPEILCGSPELADRCVQLPANKQKLVSSFRRRKVEAKRLGNVVNALKGIALL